MEVLRRAANPWGQEVLIGIGWDLMWAAVIAGVVFTLGHAIWLRTLPKDGPAEAPAEAPDIPEKITRHGGAARAFHWLMALSMIVLLITAFFPVIGIQFAWVTIHWAAGIVLILLIAWHIWHSTLRQDFWSMWVGPKEIAEMIGQLKHIISRTPDSGDRGGKYPIDHKMYHHGIVLVGFAAIITGVLMMVRVDTPFWTRNPYLLGDATWGVVYVLHGFSGVALITMVMAHVYFAIRPEKWWLTRSMIKGWITRREFLSHFDPEAWQVGDEPSQTASPTGGSGAPAGVTPSDDPTV